MPKPLLTDHAPYFSRYIDLVKEDDSKTAFQNQNALLADFLSTLPYSKADYAYAEGKWTIKQVVQHLIDCERIFSYRALWIARKSNTPLSGFDENAFAEHADVSNRTLKDLADEMIALRAATQKMFSSFTEADLQSRGISNNNEITVNAIGFITLGHVLHHKQIVEERYL
ncbi:MAG: DinB family protein [Chitinophagaceae bacterium]|nr:DinB family protein [Chitinophagaceae bacterium]